MSSLVLASYTTTYISKYLQRVEILDTFIFFQNESKVKYKAQAIKHVVGETSKINQIIN